MNRNRNLLYESDLSKDLDYIYHFTTDLSHLINILDKGELITGNKIKKGEDKDGNPTYTITWTGEVYNGQILPRFSFTRSPHIWNSGTKAFNCGIILNNQGFIKNVTDTIAVDAFTSGVKEDREYFNAQKNISVADEELAKLKKAPLDYKSRNLQKIIFANDDSGALISTSQMAWQPVGPEFAKILGDGYRYLRDNKLTPKSFSAKILALKKLYNSTWKSFSVGDTIAIANSISQIVGYAGFRTKKNSEPFNDFKQKYSNIVFSCYTGDNPDVPEFESNPILTEQNTLAWLDSFLQTVHSSKTKFQEIKDINTKDQHITLSQAYTNSYGFESKNKSDGYSGIPLDVVYTAGILSKIQTIMTLNDFDIDTFLNYSADIKGFIKGNLIPEMKRGLSQLFPPVTADITETALEELEKVTKKYRNLETEFSKSNSKEIIAEIKDSRFYKDYHPRAYYTREANKVAKKTRVDVKFTTAYQNFEKIRKIWDTYMRDIFSSQGYTKCQNSLEKLSKNNLDTEKTVINIKTIIDDAINLWNKDIWDLVNEDEERVVVTDELIKKGIIKVGPALLNNEPISEAEADLIRDYWYKTHRSFGDAGLSVDDLPENMLLAFYLNIKEEMTGIIVSAEYEPYVLTLAGREVHKVKNPSSQQCSQLEKLWELTDKNLDMWHFWTKPKKPNANAIIIQEGMDNDIFINQTKVRHISMSFKKYGL